MRLLVQSDDYGITEGVSCGIIKAISKGIVRNTGMFANMPWAEEAVSMIRPFLNEICFGIDLNINAGFPCANPKEIPSLVQDDGSFLTSSMSRQLDKNPGDGSHCVYEHILMEFCSQIERFKQLVGKTPDYINGHAYMPDIVMRALNECSERYNVPLSFNLWKNNNVFLGSSSWYTQVLEGVPQKDVDVKGFILGDKGNLLKHELSAIVCHCGYVDAPLLRLSSYNIIRAKDLDAMTDNRVLDWIKINNIELITYRDLNYYK